ncbi:MAG: hypothetical protein R2864_12690 [Syntrophotaleaceae bacterium]
MDDQKVETEAQKLRQLEMELQKYMKENNIVTVEDRMTVTPEKLSKSTFSWFGPDCDAKNLEGPLRKGSEDRQELPGKQLLSPPYRLIRPCRRFEPK